MPTAAIAKAPATTAMDGQELERCRRIQLAEVIKDIRTLCRRAADPGNRMALSEIEHELLQVSKRWTAMGLIGETEEIAA